MRTPTVTVLVRCDNETCGAEENITHHPSKAGVGDITDALRAAGWTVRDSRCDRCGRPDELASSREFCPGCTDAGKVGD